MAKNYDQRLNKNSLYADALEEIMFAYDSLFLNGFIEEEGIRHNNKHLVSLINKPAVFFYEPLQENSKEYADRVNAFEGLMKFFITHYESSQLNELYKTYYPVFLEALQYGLLFTTNVGDLTKYVNHYNDERIIYNELKNIACATVECASYFQGATFDISYLQQTSLDALQVVNNLYITRIEHAKQEQNYDHFNVSSTGKDFVAHYNRIKNAELTLSDLTSFTADYEYKRLQDAIIRSNEPQKLFS